MDDYLVDQACHDQAKALLPRLTLLDEWFEERAGEESRRAFIIEFAGMPKAGKSSAIEDVRHYFSHGPKLLVDVKGPQLGRLRDGYLLHTPAEGVSLRTPRYLKTNLLDFNTWAGAYAVQELLQARHDNYHHMVILDRGPWDASCWIRYVLEAGGEDLRLPEQEVEPIRQFFKLPLWATLSDLHVVLVVDPAIAREREISSRLIEAGGAASNNKMMTRMLEIYSQETDELRERKAKHCPETGENSVLLLNTSGSSKKQIALQIISAILDQIERKLETIRQGAPFFTAREVGELLLPTMQTAPEDVRSPVRRYIPVFVRRANELKPLSRGALRTELQQQLLEPSWNQIRASDVIEKLEGLIKAHEFTK